MKKGYLALILHCHLPFVRHPEHAEFLEERWLFEAITESYIPLIDLFERLCADSISYKVTLSISPPLCAMLSDPLLQSRYLLHIEKLIELAEKEIVRTKKQPEINILAEFYLNQFQQAKATFEKCGRNLLKLFRALQDEGSIELITSGATHGYLPLMSHIPNAVRAQVQIACLEHRRHFGRGPLGIWLPECGFYPGVDQFLEASALRYFIVDAHGLLHAAPRPVYGLHAPIYCKPKGALSSHVAAFARDPEASKQVWSADEGYPGDFDYRDFYRDIGFDLPLETIAPYIHPDQIRVHTGMKYYKITGKMEQKEIYNRAVAEEKAKVHAANFILNREDQVLSLATSMGGTSPANRKPILVAPYDAELFGHWWFEGPLWIEALIRQLAANPKVLELTTPARYLREYPKNQVATPPSCSWGYKGYNEFWLNGENDWVYRPLHKAAHQMIKMANQFADSAGILRRALNQSARELLLAQSSDWAFIMKTGTSPPYAVARTKTHLERFNRLIDEIDKNEVNEIYLKDIEEKDNLFPEIDYRVYADYFPIA
jgi:1,4-alpha-glucan branching enzyme